MAPYQWYKRLHGRTQQQVENEAQRLQRAAEEKEKYVTVDAPGDVSVTAQMTLSLSGTGTAFDQSYDIETVEHRFSSASNGGYRMTIVAKNSGKGDTGYAPSSGTTLSAPSPSTSLPSQPGFTPSGGSGGIGHA